MTGQRNDNVYVIPSAALKHPDLIFNLELRTGRRAVVVLEPRRGKIRRFIKLGR